MGRALWRELVIGFASPAGRAPARVHAAGGAVRAGRGRDDDDRGPGRGDRAVAVGHHPAGRRPRQAPPRRAPARRTEDRRLAHGLADAARPGGAAGRGPGAGGAVPVRRPAAAARRAGARRDGRRGPRDARDQPPRTPGARAADASAPASEPSGSRHEDAVRLRRGRRCCQHRRVPRAPIPAPAPACCLGSHESRLPHRIVATSGGVVVCDATEPGTDDSATVPHPLGGFVARAPRRHGATRAWAPRQAHAAAAAPRSAAVGDGPRRRGPAGPSAAPRGRPARRRRGSARGTARPAPARSGEKP